MSNSCHYKNFVEEFAEPRFNEVLRDWGNLFVIARLRYIKNFDLRSFGKTTKMFVILRYS